MELINSPAIELSWYVISFIINVHQLRDPPQDRQPLIDENSQRPQDQDQRH